MLLVSVTLTGKEKALKESFPLFAVVVLPFCVLMLRIKGIPIYSCHRHSEVTFPSVGKTSVYIS